MINQSAFNSKSVKISQNDVDLSLYSSRGPCGQSVSLLTVGDQVGVLESVSASQEMLRDGVSDAAGWSPRHYLHHHCLNISLISLSSTDLNIVETWCGWNVCKAVANQLVPWK